MCGLKLLSPVPRHKGNQWSHPAWVCGLKHNFREKELDYVVTPCVGVWIETPYKDNLMGEKCVTPCVGVWIETPHQQQEWHVDESHPAWVCGLKHLQNA